MSTNKDVIEQLKTLNATQILEKCSDFSQRGFMYEALWNIVVKFNLLPNVSITNHIKSNLNKETKICLTDFSKDFLLKPFQSGNSGGYSDITFKDQSENLYISTVKYFENECGKQRDDWDLPKLVALTKIHKNCKNLVFTKNKEIFISIYERSNKNDIHSYEFVYDLNDLEVCLKKVVEIMTYYEWNYETILKNYFGKKKTHLKLLYHQNLCLAKTSTMSKNEPILWGLKCRSGKSYIMAGHIHANKFSNVLIITPIPNESIKSLVKLFEEYIEFDNYNVIHYQRGSKIPKVDNKIIICSKQFLDGKTIPVLDSIQFNAVYSDENHWGGTTENSKGIISKYVKSNTQFITLTATYFKSQNEWKIRNEQSFFWDLEDETLCKQNDIKSLVKKFGEDAISISETHDLKTEYNEMPILTLLSVTHDPEFVAKFKQFNTDDSYSFDTTELLKCDQGVIKNKNSVNDLIDYHFGDGLNNGKNMMDRIKKYDSRTGNEFHTQLWFLPYGYGNNLNETAKCIKSMIETHKYGKKFTVEILTSENDESEKGSLYEHIESLENKAKEDSKHGLILLLGFKCSMGISLPLADVVVLLNNGESMDMYMQMMMRSMTESRGTNKKRGFVIDYNQKRVLQTALNIVQGGEMNIQENIQKSLGVVRIDEDMNVSDKTGIVDKIYDIWKNSKINRIDLIRKRLEQLPSVEFDKEDYKRIDSYMKNAVIQKETNKQEKLELNDETEKLPDGVTENSDNNSQVEKDLSEQEEDEVKIDYGKELRTSIPILTSLLTYKTKYITNILECLEIIQNDEYLKSIFISQCEVWWGIKNSDGFIDLLKYLIKKYYLNIIRSINICIENMKENIASLLDNKKELLDMINSMLKPKDVEKKKFGEVFTPFKLVEEMLDRIPTDVWSNPNLKWFDPCVGVGNFMVCVYYRLMIGLKKVIKNEDNRKIHIIKNMLYMSELNSKNVFICKTIFGEECNLNEGDTLKLDICEKWGVDKFDIIIGNPPYQDDSGNRGKGHTLWDRFIKKAFVILNENGYLIYVHPAGWRQPNHEILNILKEKQILYLSIHDEKDGLKTFQCNTRYDWYVLENKTWYKNTTIDAQDREIYNVDISKLNFIPNFMFDEIIRYTVGNEKLEIIKERSTYGTDKKHVSRDKSSVFKYPLVNSVNRKNNPTFRWSNTNENGHYKIPKVIFGGGASGYISDATGEYGLTEWCTGIVEKANKHQRIIDILDSPKFTKIRLACSVGKAELNPKVLKMFRKDFFEIFEL